MDLQRDSKELLESVPEMALWTGSMQLSIVEDTSAEHSTTDKDTLHEWSKEHRTTLRVEKAVTELARAETNASETATVALKASALLQHNRA